MYSFTQEIFQCSMARHFYKGRRWKGREHLGVFLQEAWVHDETIIEALNHDSFLNKGRGKGECE